MQYINTITLFHSICEMSFFVEFSYDFTLFESEMINFFCRLRSCHTIFFILLKRNHMKISIALLLIILSCSYMKADDFETFQSYRQVGSRGRYYIVVRRTGGSKYNSNRGPVEILIAETSVGSSPVKAAKGYAVALNDVITNVKRSVGVRDGDRIL